MKGGIPWKTKMNHEEDFVIVGTRGRPEASDMLNNKLLLTCVGLLIRPEFDDLFALKKDSAPAPHKIPHGA